MSGASSSLVTETEAEVPSHAKNILNGMKLWISHISTDVEKAVTAYHTGQANIL